MIYTIIKIYILIYDALVGWFSAIFYLHKSKKLLKEEISTIVTKSENEIVVETLYPTLPMEVVLMEEDIHTMSQVKRLAYAHNSLQSKKRCTKKDPFLDYKLKTCSNKPFLGVRQVLGEVCEKQNDGHIFKKLNLGDYNWIGMKDALLQSAMFGKGLRSCGVQLEDRVLLFSETRAEWLMSAVGCFMEGITMVTLYSTLRDEDIIYGMKQTAVTHVIVSVPMFSRIESILKEIPSVSHVIVFEEKYEKFDATDLQLGNDVKVLTFSDVIDTGGKSSSVKRTIEPETTAMIMYTSGSTGIPKGVMLSQKNFLSTVMVAQKSLKCNENDVYIGYLPLAHIYECIAEFYFLSLDVPIAYSSFLTLMTGSSGLQNGCKGDVNMVNPTVVTVVPLVLNRICKKIGLQLNEKSSILPKIFSLAVCYKEMWLSCGYDTPILNCILFGKTRRLFGNRVRMVISGGARLSKDTQSFLRCTLCCPVIAGYGLTETTALATLSTPGDVEIDHVGYCIDGNKLKLVNWDAGGYRITDRPNPRGEIIVGGNTVSSGYFRTSTELNKNFFEEAGTRWFLTGDIGELRCLKRISIIDRKSDLIKLENGEFISFNRIEEALHKSQYVDRIFAYARPGSGFVIAIIKVDSESIVELARTLNKDGKPLPALCEDDDIRREVKVDLLECSLKGKTEIPKMFKLCDDMWAPENDLLSPAFKLKRKKIADFYAGDINNMYNEGIIDTR